MMRWAFLLAVGLVLAGCGDADVPATPVAVPTIDRLAGARVGAMAERELENAHPGMAAGHLTCPDLRWTVGAAVRCVQVAVLSAGRQVRIPGTVTVTDVAGGGRLHVRLDDRVAEYGVAASYLSSELTEVATRRLGVVPSKVRCPYLSGPVGTTVRCAVAAGREHVVRARVTSRDDASNATGFTFDW
ncbi:MAG: hypothetical protein JWQ74_3361 [Marmoricola sp.]|nr:hypothetical protein [Marmoricola sp.]